jgi:monovalent cation:proton antiporter-2 (CPA2) family protein
MEGLLFQAFVYLCAAVIAVPIAKRLGLGSVLGYLIAGIVIGPVIGLVGAETKEIQHFAEFGVVMMLFLVGLELEPRMLWDMRKRLLGLGGLQVGITTALITGVALLLGQYWSVALAIGLIFALSSTAIVLQTLSEKGLDKTEGGRGSFSVLLFQDIAVIPMLALIPLLALPELAGHGVEEAVNGADAHDSHGHGESMSLVDGLPGWAHALVVLGAVATVLLGGHFLSRPLFRFIAESRLREIFTASALLLVIGIALLMTLVGLSPALGTFLAGVVLANSEFRHELESDIEPFKGLLLGLFFITVGAGIDFGVLFGDFAVVVGITLGVIFLKGLILFGLAKLFRLSKQDGWLFALGLAQAGEFGFVLLSFTQTHNVIPSELAKTLSLVVALSMLLTPALFILYDKMNNRCFNDEEEEKEADAIDEKGTVIIAGCGRFGFTVNRLLVSAGVRTVVLDHEASTIDMLRTFEIKGFYGDATRPDLLHAAGIEEATAIVVAIDDRERVNTLVEYVHANYPHVKILTRAFNMAHYYTLHKLGADVIVREVLDSSLNLGKEALKVVGVHPFKAQKMTQALRNHDQKNLDQLYEIWDQDPDILRNQLFISRAKEQSKTLIDVLQADLMQTHDRSERGWTPPPKRYLKEFE